MALAQSQIPADYGDPTIENRFLGLDKRIIGPALGILAIVVFWAGFIPWLDDAIEGDAVEPGTVISLTGGVEFTPATGWQTDGPVFPGGNTLTVFNDGVFFTISPGGWNGTADELLDELIDGSDYFVKGDRVPLTVPSGVEGVGVDISLEDETGILVALVSDEDFGDATDRVTGIRIDATAPFDYTTDDQEDVAEMIASIRVLPPDERTPTDGEEDSP